MLTGHFFKTLTTFIFIILFGIILLFIIGRIEEKEKKNPTIVEPKLEAQIDKN